MTNKQNGSPRNLEADGKLVVGARWRNRRTKRTAVIEAIGALWVYYKYEKPAKGAKFVQSPSVKIDNFQKAFQPL